MKRLESHFNIINKNKIKPLPVIAKIAHHSTKRYTVNETKEFVTHFEATASASASKESSSSRCADKLPLVQAVDIFEIAVEGEVEKPSQKSMASNTPKRKNQRCIIVVELVIGRLNQGMFEAFFAMVLIVCVCIFTGVVSCLLV